MYNTIRLLKGTAELTGREFKSFEEGKTVFGVDQEPEAIKTWSIEQEQDAIKELSKLKCSYRKNIDGYSIIEYALEYFETDGDGDFLSGSDFELAEKE